MSRNTKVDSTDVRILKILLKNSRTNVSQIAKECGISSSAIVIRIKKLEESKVIASTSLELKRGTFGYPYQVTVGVIAEIPLIESVAAEVRKQPNVVVCTKSIGKFNLLCLLLAKSMDDLEKITQKIKNIAGVKGISINIITDQCFRDIEEVKESIIDKNLEIDDLDKKIIEELIDSSWIPFTKIAQRLKISHETVRNKFEKMKLNGIIKSCSINVDWSKLGYQGTMFVFISQKSGTEKTDIVKELKKNSSIFLINNVIGAYDLVAFSTLKDLKDFAKTVDYIQQTPGVEQIDVCFAAFTYFSFAPIPRAPIQCDTLELS